MPNFQPSSVINFTGSIAGSPASTVASNAVSGLTAFNDTIFFRDPASPNGTLSVFSPNTGIATQDGNVVVNIDYTYTDGNRVADYYVIFYKQGGGTVSPANPCIVVNPSSGVASSARINVVPGSPYTFAFSSARVTKDGVRASSPQNQTARTMIAGNYTANIAGISAASIASAGKVVSATIDKQAINYSVTGAATPTSINITATTQNITSPHYTFYRDIGAGFVEIQARSTDNSLSAYSGIPPVNTAYQFKVDAHEGNVATVAASDFVTVYGLASGSNALTTIISNESHSIPADSTGSPTSYAGSGTTIRLYEGSTELTYVASAPAAGQWTVIASPTNITTGSLTATSGYLTVGNHSAITSSTASIDYNISGTRQNGTSIPSFKRIQSLVKTNAGTAGAGGSPAQYIVVTGDQAFRYSSDSTTSVPAQITLSAELYGGLTTYNWQYYNTTNSAWSPASVTTQTYTVSPATPGFTGNSFRVRCVSGSFTDETTLVKLFDGTNAKVGYLTNEAFVSTTNSSGGSPVYEGGNGIFKVFNGITDISTGAGTSYGILSGTGTPSPIASVTRNGLTLAIGASTGIYSPSGTAWSTDSESFTLRATTNAANGSVVIDKVFNIAKSRAGTPGLNGSPGTNVATVYLYQRTTNTTSPTMPADPITYTFSTGGINSPNTGWFSAIPSFTGTNPYLWVTLATASNSASTDTINSNEWQAAKLLSQNGTDGSPGAAGFSTAVLTAYIRSAFAPSTTPGTIVYTFSSSAWTPTNGWSKTIPSANGLPLWAVSATAFSTDPTDTVNSGDWSTPTKVLIDPTSAIGGNLITQSENLSAWTFGSASVSPGILYLDGSTQFWKVYENTTTSAYHDIIAPTPFPSISVGDRVTLSANVMKGERVRHVMYLATDPWSPNNWPLSTFDLSAGLVLSNSATVADAGIFEVGNIGASKVYRIYITTVPATVAASTYPLLRTSLDDGTQLYASASPGSGFYATRVQLSKGYLAEYLKTDTTTIQNNAAVGDAFTGTTELRVKTAPSNNATIGSITSAATADGNSVITVPITYTQSPAGVLADGVIVYYKEGPTGANSPANDHKGFSLDTTDSATTRNVQFTLKPSQEYNFSVRAYRRAEGGRKYTTFSAVSTHTSTSPNYTGLIAGSPAATVRDNANNAFTGTTNYRQNVSPSSDPSTPTITQSATADGNIVAKVAYTYSPGSIPADFILIYAKENGGTISPAVQSFATNAVTGDLSLVLKPSTTYRFAAQAVRRTESGIKGGNIISTADIALTSPNYTGLIAGSPAATVRDNANNAFTGTAKYRTAGAPTNLVIPTGISAPVNSNGTKTIRVSWAPYVQGANQADVIGLFYRRDNNIPTYVDSCVVMNVNVNTSAYYDLQGVNPEDLYSFGIAAGRRTENGIEWGLINTTYGTGTFSLYNQDLVGGYTPAPIGATISPLTEYAPDGSLAYRITDIDGTFQAGSEGIGINAISAEKYMVEAWVKQDTGTTNRFLFRVIGYNGASNSYHDIVLRYDTGAVTGAGPSNWASGSPEYYVETHVVDGVTWYKVGNAVNVSPGATQVYLDFYPAFSSPAGATGGITGSGIIGGGTIRKLSSPDVGFDWTAITASTANFTGNIGGSPASSIATGTAKYRQDVSPTNDPGVPTITQSATADGNVVAKVAYTYSQGAIPADFVLIYAKENGGTISPAVQSFATNAVTGDLSLVLKPSTTYRFAAQAVRRTESGIKGGNIISTADIALTSPNYTGLIAGSPAGNVAANAVSGATAFTGTVNYRQNSAPTNNATFGTISPSYTSDGNAVVNVPYSYTNGALPADFLIVYYKEGGGATVSPDNPGFSTNPSPGNLNFTLKPNTSYRFGIQAVRRTESGLVGTSILASSADTVLTAGNYTGNVNSVPASTVTTAVSNFNSSNDRNSTSPTTPTLTNTIADYAPIILNTDGTADIEFNWSYTNGSPLAANNVDGFIVYVQSFNYPNNYTFTGSETSSVVPVANTSSYGYTFKNLPAHQWHNMAVRAYRVVDSDIASPSILYSTFAKSTYNNTRGITSTAQFPVGQKTHTASSSPVWNNLFQFTDDYTSVNWIKVNAAVARSTTERAPDGRTFAWEMTDSGSTSPDVAHNIYQAIIPTGPYCVFKCFVKQKTPGTGVNLRFGTNAFGGGLRNFQFEISPTSMTFPTSGNGHGSVRPLQNGWYEFITAYPVTSPNATNMQFMATRNLSVNYSGSPDIGNGLYFANLATYNVAGIIGVSPALPSTIDVVGSTWYDTVSRSLKIWDGSSWVENSTVGAIFGSSPSNLLGLSGDGENRIPQRYSGGFSVLEVDVDSGDRNKYPVFLGSPSKGSGISGVSVGSFTNQASFGDLGPASGYYGSYAIKIKFNGNTAGDEVYFASSPAGYNIQLTPNSKWIVSGKGWLSSPSIIPFTTQLGLLTAVNPTTGYRANSTISTRKTWTDLSGILNLTNDSSTLGTLVAGANITGGTGGSPYLWLDGLMLERKVGPGSTPTPWSKGSQYGVLGNSKGSALIPSSSIGVGQFFNGMTMNQGDGNARPIISGFYVATARDTDNIIFPTAYATLPSVIFFPGAQTTGSPFANTTNVSSVCEAQNLTTTGFTARIRFIGVASSTSPITDTVNFGTGSPSVLSPGSPDSAGYVGAPSPSIAINKTNGAEAFDDKYKYTFRVTVNNNFIASGEPYEPGNMDVGLYARKAAGWYLVSTQNIRGGTAGPSTSKTVSPTVTIDGVIFSPASGQAEFAIINLSGGLSGTVDSFQSVSYSVANPPTDVSATAAGSYPVPFAVIATSGSS